jgi:hypothetical protein
MDKNAILSPTDPQINILNDTYSVKSLMKLNLVILKKASMT